MDSDRIPFRSLLDRLPEGLNISRPGVIGGAVAVVAFAGSAAATYLQPLEDTADGVAPQLLALIVGAVGLGGLFLAAEWLLNLVRHRRILGRWLYVTYPDRPPRPGAVPPDGFGFGLMTIGFGSAGEVDYRVDLYRTSEDLLAAADGSGAGEAALGSACSEAARYLETQDALRLIYFATFVSRDAADRQGKLELAVDGGGKLTGRWVSDVNKSVLSSGVMIAARRRDFAATLAQAKSAAAAAWAD
ncbi:hypothetical protein Q0812_05805 [Brevundimonas sp. 2R-24]|uniref:SMODS-associating 2TM beta-strand rich effector domain-containing protein n=1 Tax=Peiella sedimenti TaxID=3061083 RepID=A0ABT8SK93_9CAUL|nr:hypothetical protein [Caulobacteraceae bacterium XZ-24]